MALEHGADAGEVGLQPVLVVVAPGRLGQGHDHPVDVVLELADLPGGIDGDRSGEVALGHRGGDVGDRAHLGGEVAGELVDARRQPVPRARHALDLGLAAEHALGADLAGHAGDLGGEGRQLVDHLVDGVLQLEDLAARADGDVLGQVTERDRLGDLGDVADLVGEVVGHRVDRVGEVLPRAGDTRAPWPGRRACPRCRPRGPHG